MPLFCISLLALLFLPLSLSCDSNTSPEKVRNDYSPVMETEINNTIREITTLLQNTSCTELDLKPHNHNSDNTNVVSTLQILTCKMKNLKIPHTEKLVRSVLTSIRCTCPDKPTKDPSVHLRRTATRHRGNEQKKIKRETKKLCKAQAILSTMTECYQMLNSRLVSN